MQILQQMLARASASQDAVPRPAGVLGLVLLQGTQVVDKVVFDAFIERTVADPELGQKLFGAMDGLLNFFPESHFDEGGDWVSFKRRVTCFVALSHGSHMLVALNLASVNVDQVVAWLRSIAQVNPLVTQR